MSGYWSSIGLTDGSGKDAMLAWNETPAGALFGTYLNIGHSGV
jgi:hypothetical protein